MHFLEYYYKTVVKYDLINKFTYKTSKEIPQLKKIILNFNCKNFGLKSFAATILSLKLITFKRNTRFTNSKFPNLLLKIQQGQPVGCKIILTKFYMYQFIFSILLEIISKIPIVLILKRSKKNMNFCSFKLSNNQLIFDNLKEHFSVINNISDLHITIITDSKTQNELFFLLKSFKIPVKKTSNKKMR
jgi:ribosomal protein L5